MQNNARGQNSVSLMYHVGRGVDESDRMAYGWCLKCVNNGLRESRFIIRIMRDIGLGIGQSDRYAEVWFWKSLAEACRMRTYIYKGSGQSLDPSCILRRSGSGTPRSPKLPPAAMAVTAAVLLLLYSSI
ncbi:hypothetical protein DFQ27_009684 [Actinomortierella ambigua]|uniref:Uncharacterized protein n=1 Tax=Actinomortierella ambigua TaxID=1343610 RepID=A0A9P6PPA8_9FUNG|nr:hypothetical protein DFQ27_009684 [Actinomortierella ambigua]